jgi:Macrocin-O-methyltransferase (TylF)
MLNGATNFIETGRMLRECAIRPTPPLRTRLDVHDVGLELVRTATRPVYLEFGVYRGETISYWSKRLSEPRALFVGFDSFEGLPEAWTMRDRIGAFSTDGAIPRIDDGRVSFVKGWFSETLPTFTVPEHDRLVVNIDSDLYSSAATVLGWARPHLRSGDLLYFDEFHDRLHEGRAFRELVMETGWRFEMAGCTPGMEQVLFVRQ